MDEIEARVRELNEAYGKGCADGFEAGKAENEQERAQWQEQCGQNYVRATEAEMREEKKDERIAELEAANDAMVKFITVLSDQELHDEMDSPEDADWSGAYDYIVRDARRTLKALEKDDQT